MQIRDVILACFMAGWVVVTIITAWRTGTVPAELWAVPGVGIGALMALFRTTDAKPTSGDSSAQAEKSQKE